MLNFLPGPLIAIIAFLLYVLAISILGILFFCILLICLIIPIPAWRKKIISKLFNMPSIWSETVRWTMWLTTSTKWTVTGIEQLNKQHSYLLIANHQDFLDILVLQKVLDRHIPQLRYFMKKQLFWMPIVGQACWILGYPFMQRHSKSYLKKHPEKRNQDLETTKKTCERFRNTPITLINYVEGTRFTTEKHHRQQSPFKNLLKPKAGGIAFVLSAIPDQIDTILNTTIIYSTPHNISWTFLQGKMKHITVHVEAITIPKDLRGDYQNDREFRIRFQNWLNQLWAEKDCLIEQQYQKFS